MNTASRYVAGSEEYLTVTVTADVTLDAQPVALSIDHGATWLPATWQGEPGTTRKVRTDEPVTFTRPSPYRPTSVLVRVTDTPEVPLIAAGSFDVRLP